jgi:hypothetical protein
MTFDEAKAIVKRLQTFFPFPEQSTETLGALIEKLQRLPLAERAGRAAESWIDHGERFPTWSQLLAAYHRLPGPRVTRPIEATRSEARFVVREIFRRAFEHGDITPAMARRLGVDVGFDPREPGDEG